MKQVMVHSLRLENSRALVCHVTLAATHRGLSRGRSIGIAVPSSTCRVNILSQAHSVLPHRQVDLFQQGIQEAMPCRLIVGRL